MTGGPRNGLRDASVPAGTTRGPGRGRARDAPGTAGAHSPSCFRYIRFRWIEEVEIDLVGVELGAVDAGELGSLGGEHAAAAAHAGAVDHHRVEADHRLDPVRPGRLGDRLHHPGRPDRQHEVDLPARLDQGLELVGHEPLEAVGAVVGRDQQLVADRADLLLEDHQLLVPRSDDRDHVVAGLLHGPGRRVGDRRADAAADHHHRAVELDVRGLAQRPDQVEDRIAGVQHVEQLGRLADALDDDRDRPLLRVGIGDGQRDALAVGVQPEDDELAGLPLPGDARRLDDEPLDIGREKLGLDDRKHAVEPRQRGGDRTSRGQAVIGLDLYRPGSATRFPKGPSSLVYLPYQETSDRRNREKRGIRAVGCETRFAPLKYLVACQAEFPKLSIALPAVPPAHDRWRGQGR